MPVERRTVIRIVVSVVAIAILIVALRGVDLARVLNIILSANAAVLPAVLLVQAVEFVVRLVRWKYQLRPARAVSLGTLVPPLLISFAVGNVTATGVGAVPRVYLLNRRTGIDGAFIAGTLLQEFLLDAFAVVLWAAIVPFLVSLPPEFRQLQLVLILPLVLLVVVEVGLKRRWHRSPGLLGQLGLRDRIQSLLPEWIRRRLGAFGDGVSSTFADPVTATVVMLATVSIWVLEASIFWLLLSSLAIPFTYLQASAVMAFTHVAIGVPAAPGFIGTLEVAAVGMVLALGGAQADALAYTALLHIMFVAPSTIVGAALAWREGWRLGAGGLRSPNEDTR